jgi:hypothetical protein
VPVPLSGNLPAVLAALTNLRVSWHEAVDVSGLTGLRRLALRAVFIDGHSDSIVKGLSRLTALEDLRFEDEHTPMARPSDLAPLTALTRLAMASVPPELASLPVAARLLRLELQAFGALEGARRGGGGGGTNGTAAAAFAALARGAPLLERLRIYVGVDDWTLDPFLMPVFNDVELGDPLGPGVAWPSLTHLEVTPWAALLLAACAFPRLSRLAARIIEPSDGSDIASNEQLRTAVAALAAQARDHAALLFDDYRHVGDDGAGVLAAAAAVPRLRHLSWQHPPRQSWQPSRRHRRSAAAAPLSGWAPLAASLESLKLAGHLADFC